jgi:hypothetical protein
MIVYSGGAWLIVEGRRVVGRYGTLKSAREALWWLTLRSRGEPTWVCALPPDLPKGPRLVKTDEPAS